MNDTMTGRRTAIAALAMVLAAFTGGASAEDPTAEVITYPDIEWEKHAPGDTKLQHLTDGLMGDSIDPHLGGLSFEHTDVSLPGNSGLEVAIRRKREQGDFYLRQGPNAEVAEFGDWQLAAPRIRVMLPHDQQWGASRCSQSSVSQLPPASEWSNTSGGPVATYFILPREYSEGVMLDVPGQGSEEILDNPQGTQWRTDTEKVTLSGWTFSCIASINGGGEGFIGTAPNGDTYRFDRLVYRDAPFLGSIPVGASTLFRKHAIIFATRVEDVNGNWVDYTYNGSGRLTRIHANDGREIRVNYQASSDLIDTVVANPMSAAPRTWTYRYGSQSVWLWNDVSHNFSNALTRVIRPDALEWGFQMGAMSINAPAHHCLDPGVQTVTVTHPHGMTGTFKLGRQYRRIWNLAGAVAPLCPYDADRGWSGPPPYVTTMAIMAVTEKTLSGPGVPAATWTYGGPITLADTPATERTIARGVTDPTGNTTVYYHRWLKEPLGGKLMRREVRQGSGTGPLLEATEYSYIFEDSVGSSYMPPFPEQRMRAQQPVRTQDVVVTRHSDTFHTRSTYVTDHAAANYSYGFPTKVERWSSLAPEVRVADIDYAHNTTEWILGLRARITLNGKVFQEGTYDSLGRIIQLDRFEAPYKTFGYHGAGAQGGALAWAEDALSRRTSFASYKRGVPQLVTRPDLTPLSRVVDDNGWVTSQTNARGVTTGYEYNSVGWLTRIDRVDPWLDTTISYSNLSSGLQQRVLLGGKETYTWHDALLRPELVRTQALSGTGLTTYVKTSYDIFGRETFASYPSTSSSPTVGMETSYDALGRVTQTRENTAPFATTTTAYLSGNRTRVTDPRGFDTTTTLRAYGSPDHGDVIRIEQPEGVATDMTYDAWGNMLSATQGGGASHTQSYVYDTRFRLCRHSVPETGDTLYDYDAADQMTHVARGQSGGTTCPTTMPSGDTIVRTYDALGRVDIVNYPGITPDIDFDYDLNGNVTRNARGIAVWDYTYDTADNLTEETLSVDGRTYSTTYAFNPSGGLLSHTTPAGREVTFAPNWLGQPNRAGVPGYNYAIGFTYHPDGSVAGFTYGNGQIMTRSLNTRQLVDGITVAKAGGATAVDLTYAYDANGRIIEKIDRATPVIAGPLTPRTVESQYDSKNRLWRFRDTLEDNAWQLVYYDARGNVRDTGTIAYGGLDIFYDTAEQPMSMGGAVTASFVYDGNLKRVKQTINGETIYSVYGQSGAILYRDNVTTGETTDYIRANGMTLARLRGGVTTFPHADHLGSPVAATDAGGNVLWREQYTAFGEKRLDPALNFDNEGFTGHIDDAATGLTYMQARYYDPVIGRFLSNDPVAFAPDRPQYFNRYSYALNDPVNKIDPDGEFAQAIVGAIVGAVIDGGIEAAVQVATTGGISDVGAIGGAAAEGAAIGALTGGVGNVVKAGKGAAKIASATKKTCCFVAGTLVETETGMRPIEEIEIGDKVWARDTDTGETSLKPVTDLIRRHERVIWEVRIAGADGAAEFFETTDDHPWWIVSEDGSGRWLNTEQLEAGMDVVSRGVSRGARLIQASTASERDLSMTIVSVAKTDRIDQTYNLTVADFHTYFVGETRVLVHNCTPKPGSPALKGDPFSPGEVSKRQSETRGALGMNKDPDTPIGEVNSSPGGTIQGGGVKGDVSKGGDSRPAHGTGERNVGTREEHSRTAKGNDPGPRRRDF